MSNVSVIIVNWNGAQFLKGCLDSLKEQSMGPWETIVVDNASTDGSAEQIATFYPWVKLQRNITNTGYAAANNQGIKLSQGDKILFLNMDTKLSPDFIGHLSKALDETPGLGSVCGKLLLMQKGEQTLIDSVGIKVSPERYVIELGHGQEDAGQFSLPAERFGGSGAAVMYRRQVLDEVAIEEQIFDEDFFAYNEDVDLAWRCQLYGWSCRYLPQALGWHRRGGGKAVVEKWLRRRIKLNYYSMIYKNETSIRELPALFWKLRVHEEIISCDPVLWLEFLQKRGGLNKKRDLIQVKRRVSPEYINKLMAQ